MDKPTPVIVHHGGRIDGLDEVFNELFLTAEVDAGADGLVNRNQDALVYAVCFMVLSYEHEDIVDVDFNLPNQLDFKDNVFIDFFLLGILFLGELLVQVNINALVVLKIAAGQNFVAQKIVEGV